MHLWRVDYPCKCDKAYFCVEETVLHFMRERESKRARISGPKLRSSLAKILYSMFLFYGHKESVVYSARSVTLQLNMNNETSENFY